MTSTNWLRRTGRRLGPALILSLPATCVWPAAIGAAESADPADHDRGPDELGTAEEENKRNHLSLFIGSTESEKEIDGSPDDPRFTLGLDYERLLNRWLGVGGLLDWVAEGDRELLIGIPVFFHVYRGAELQVAPSVQRLRDGEWELVARVGVAYEFELRRVTLAPVLNLDFSEGESFLVLGLNVGRWF